MLIAKYLTLSVETGGVDVNYVKIIKVQYKSFLCKCHLHIIFPVIIFKVWELDDHQFGMQFGLF